MFGSEGWYYYYFYGRFWKQGYGEDQYYYPTQVHFLFESVQIDVGIYDSRYFYFKLEILN